MSGIRWYGYLFKLFLRDLISFFIFIFLIIKNSIIREKEKGARILVYHSINDADKKNDTIRMTVPAKLFSKQLDYLVSCGYNIVSFDDIVEYISGEKEVKGNILALTFDDGFKDNFYNACKILKSKGLTATYFLSFDHVNSGKSFAWVKERSYWAKSLVWDEVSLMVLQGMAIGSHTLSHLNLGGISDDGLLDKEIRGSKEKIEEKIKAPVKYFSYPIGCRGSYNKKTETIIRQAGYKAACVNIFGENKKGANLFELKRTRIDWNDTLFKFRMKLEGAYDWIDQNYA